MGCGQTELISVRIADNPLGGEAVPQCAPLADDNVLYHTQNRTLGNGF